MDVKFLPALTPLEGAMLPAIEMKGVQKRPNAALHAALERWKNADAPITPAPEARPKPPQAPAQHPARLLSRAAYAYAMGKRKS